MLSLARRRGAKIIEANPVSEIIATDSSVRVKVASGQIFEGDRLVIAAGAWTSNLLGAAWNLFAAYGDAADVCLS